MKRMMVALALVLLVAMIGCSEGAHVEKGGGESAVLELKNNQYTGRVDVQGHVVNTGVNRANDVVLTFMFYQGGALYLEGKLRLGDITVGASKDFSGTFFGPAVTPAAFTWDYRIDWD